MKKQNVLSFAFLLLLSLPAYSQVSDNRLGNLIVVERSYTLNLESLQANLRMDEVRKNWTAEVPVANDGKDVVAVLKPIDYLVVVDSMNVIFMVLPDSYKAYVTSMRATPTREQAEKALTLGFQQLELHNKVQTLRFSKIDR